MMSSYRPLSVWNSLLSRGLVLFALGLTVQGPSTAVAQAKYASAEEAFGVGVAYVNAKNYAASQEPLEIALQLARNDAMKLRVSDALVLTYTKLANVPKMVERAEYIIEKSDQEARRSNVRGQLLNFIHEQGKLDEFIARHEAVLKNDPENHVTLYVLSEAFDKLRRDPVRAAALTERLIALEKKQQKPQDVTKMAALASQYAKAKKHQEAAELFEQVAPLDEKLAAWHWKEAATNWLEAKDNKRAIEAARKSLKSAPETRSEILEYFWRKNLADVFLKTGEAATAASQYEAALKKTKIEGYRKECERLLAEAKSKSQT
jgi:tetratricopeptide (TPR) repeat protein